MSRDPSVDAYIDRAAPFAREILDHIRNRVHAIIPAVEETIKWSMPAFTLGGKILLITAAFKEHAALNFWRGKDLRAGDNHGSLGQFGKLKSLSDLPPNAELDRLIADAAKLAAGAPTPRTAKHPPKEAAEPHPDLIVALAASRAARATFDGLSPSARRDYVDWIGQAKQDGTRARRIAQAVEWLGEGKKRNWKYESG